MRKPGRRTGVSYLADGILLRIQGDVCRYSCTERVIENFSKNCFNFETYDHQNKHYWQGTYYFLKANSFKAFIVCGNWIRFKCGGEQSCFPAHSLEHEQFVHYCLFLIDWRLLRQEMTDVELKEHKCRRALIERALGDDIEEIPVQYWTALPSGNEILS